MICGQRQNGFTLIEMIAVIIILGFMAIAIIPRFVNSGNFQSRTAADLLISSARQAQQLAMTKATTANVTLITDNTNKQIRITFIESGTQTITVDLAQTVTITGSTTTFAKSGEAGIGSQRVINITPDSRNVCIETTGYTHAC